MKINNSFEQGVYVVVILALQKDHTPVKSKVMSNVLQVSDSYLKKILMKLSKNGIVRSSASKQGGYQLARNVEELSLKDIFVALELDEGTFETSHYAQILFPGQKHAIDTEQRIEKVIQRGLDRFYEELGQTKISSLLEEGAYENGAIVWEERVN